MNKKAYTLAEMLITLGIIATIAAVTAPLINKFKPDTNKISYLQSYDAISVLTKEMASNNRFFPLAMEGSELDFSERPLANNTAIFFNGENYEGNTKYCELLSDLIKISDKGTCHVGAQSFINNLEDNNFSFISQNGVVFWVNTTNNPATSIYETEIFIDVNGLGNSPNCLYSTQCSRPDRFKILVASDGQVSAADPIGRKYLRERTSLRYNRDISNIDGDGITSLIQNN